MPISSGGAEGALAVELARDHVRLGLDQRGARLQVPRLCCSVQRGAATRFMVHTVVRSAVPVRVVLVVRLPCCGRFQY